MGNNESKRISVTDYDHTAWKIIGTHKSISEIVQNLKSQEQAESQILYFDPKLDLQKEIEIYEYRKNQNNTLVKCIAVHVEQTETKSLCGNKHVLRVLTERIPLRLSQFPQLTFEESIYALCESIKGYKDCYHKLGPFEVTDEMIGINNDGEVRVWVNSDFAQNHPLTEKPLLYTSGTCNPENQRVEQLSLKKDQVQMIKNIIGLIERKCEFGHFPSDFKQKIDKNLSNFNQAFEEIEQYVSHKKLFIPDRIMNMNTSYAKGKYFTTGEQYLRDKNDPLYRKRKSFLPESKESLKFDINQDNAQFSQSLKQNGHKNSPILKIYENEDPVNIEQSNFKGQTLLQSPRVQAHNLHSKVTFNVKSPEVSTLVFNEQSCIYPHKVFQK